MVNKPSVLEPLNFYCISIFVCGLIQLGPFYSRVPMAMDLFVNRRAFSLDLYVDCKDEVKSSYAIQTMPNG